MMEIPNWLGQKAKQTAYTTIGKSINPKSKGGKVSMHHEKHTLNFAKYKEDLWKCIEPLLEVYGLAETNLEKLRDELLN